MIFLLGNHVFKKGLAVSFREGRCIDTYIPTGHGGAQKSRPSRSMVGASAVFFLGGGSSSVREPPCHKAFEQKWAQQGNQPEVTPICWLKFVVNWGRMTSTPSKEIHHVKTTATTKTKIWVHPSPLDASHVFFHFSIPMSHNFQEYSLQGWGWNYGSHRLFERARCILQDLRRPFRTNQEPGNQDPGEAGEVGCCGCFSRTEKVHQ